MTGWKYPKAKRAYRVKGRVTRDQVKGHTGASPRKPAAGVKMVVGWRGSQ